MYFAVDWCGDFLPKFCREKITVMYCSLVRAKKPGCLALVTSFIDLQLIWLNILLKNWKKTREISSLRDFDKKLRNKEGESRNLNLSCGISTISCGMTLNIIFNKLHFLTNG